MQRSAAWWSATQNGSMLPPPLREGESAIAEPTNGTIVITARINAAPPHINASECGEGNICRMFAQSDNGGMSWSRVWHVPYEMLPAPRCEATMTSVDLPGHETGLLLFGAPNEPHHNGSHQLHSVHQS